MPKVSHPAHPQIQYVLVSGAWARFTISLAAVAVGVCEPDGYAQQADHLGVEGALQFLNPPVRQMRRFRIRHYRRLQRFLQPVDGRQSGGEMPAHTLVGVRRNALHQRADAQRPFCTGSKVSVLHPQDLVRSGPDAVAIVLDKLTEGMSGESGAPDGVQLTLPSGLPGYGGDGVDARAFLPPVAMVGGAGNGAAETGNGNGRGNGNGYGIPVAAGVAYSQRCPECNGGVVNQEGCSTCYSCGWNKCE